MHERIAFRAVAAVATATSAATLLAATPLHAQAGDFEGVVTLSMTSPKGSTSTAEYMLKDGKVRIETSGRVGFPAVLQFDPATHALRVVLTPQQVYMERAVSDSELARAASRVHASAERTGRTDTVAGQQCEHWNVTDRGERYDVCIAKGFGSFIPEGSAFGTDGAPAWQRELKAGGFPLEVTRADGTKLLEATRIERKTLDASLFEVPAGFRKVDFPAGMLHRAR